MNISKSNAYSNKRNTYIYINIKLLHLERYINLIDYEIVKIIQRINDDYKM